MKDQNWISVKDGLPEKQGRYKVCTNDDAQFWAILGVAGQWRHETGYMYADLYPSKDHPDWTDAGGGLKNIQKRQVTHYQLNSF